VNAPLASRLPFEVLYRIRQINFRTIDASFFKGSAKQSSGRADKWPTSQVLFVAGLLADENDFRKQWAFPKNGSRCIFVKVTALASVSSTL
jgi:hypothetical protein